MDAMSVRRQPRLLAHHAYAGRIMLVPGINGSREEIVGGSEAGIIPGCIDQRNVLGMAVGIPQRVSHQQQRGEFLKGLVLVAPWHVCSNRLRNSLPRGFILLSWA